MQRRGRRERRERDPENAYITDTRIRIVLELGSMGRFEFYVSKEYAQHLRRFKELTVRDGLSPSKVLCRLIAQWVNDHTPGNVQTPLLPDVVRPAKEYSKYPVERRRQAMDDLMDTINANPEAPIDRIIAAFSHATGLREQTLVAYLRTLKKEGKLKRGY